MRLGGFPAFVLVVVMAASAGAQDSREDREFFRASTSQWSFDASFGSLFDSNIDRDELERNDQGIESAFVARYRDRGRHHRFWIFYKGGAQFFNRSERWDAGRSNFVAALERNIGSRFIVGARGGHSLKVSADDRELTQQFVATPLVEYQIARSTRLLTFGGFELRRPAEPEYIQRIRSVGAEVATELGKVSLFRFGYTYEGSDSDRSSLRYGRNTLEAGYDADFGNTSLRFELRYRERRYSERLVDVGESEVPRLDVRIMPSASWIHQFPGGQRLEVRYQYETRTSNDPTKDFRGQRIELSIRVPLTGRVAARPDRRGRDGPPTSVLVDDVRTLAEHEEFRTVEAESFSGGSEWSQVLKAQGVPANISERPRFYEELWFYGKSWVVLKQGRVISWHDTGNLKLTPETVEHPPSKDGEARDRPEASLRKASRPETISDIAARERAGKAQTDGQVSPPVPDLLRVVESPSVAVARVTRRQVVLKDGSRIEGRLQKYENGLAYIVITVGVKRKSLLTTLPEELIDKEATARARSPEK